MDQKRALKAAYEAIADKKGENTRVIDISGVSVIADYFIVTNGSNNNQVKAIADNVEERLGKLGMSPRQIEGYNTAAWILMDFGGIIVHIFSKEDRIFYDLERIWSDGRQMSVDEIE